MSARALLVLALLALPAAAQTVVLAERASTPNAYVALAEVADLRDAEPALAARFGEIYLGPAPGVYDREHVASRMARYGFEASALRFEGAGSVRVERGPTGRAMPAASGEPETRQVAAWTDEPASNREADRLVVRAVEDHARRWVGSRVDDATVEVQSIDWAGAGPGLERLEGARVVDAPIVAGDTYRYQVQVRTERGRLLTASARAIVRYLARQVVARADLSRNRILGANDLADRIVALSDPERALPFDRNALVGRRLVRSVRAGDPITADDVEDVPVVKQGDRVRMIYRGQGFTIEAIGRAEGDAGMGDWVVVKNLKSKKEILARAIGPATVEVSARDSGR